MDAAGPGDVVFEAKRPRLEEVVLELLELEARLELDAELDVVLLLEAEWVLEDVPSLELTVLESEILLVVAGLEPPPRSTGSAVIHWTCLP